MDDQAKIPRSLIDELSTAADGIEIPANYGGPGASFSPVWQSRDCRGSIRGRSPSRRENTIVIKRCCEGATTVSAALTDQGSPAGVGAYALSEAGSGASFALTTRARRRGTATRSRAASVDHNGNEADISSSSAVNPGRLRGITALSSNALPVQRRKEGKTSRHPREQTCELSSRTGVPKDNVSARVGKGYKSRRDPNGGDRIGPSDRAGRGRLAHTIRYTKEASSSEADRRFRRAAQIARAAVDVEAARLTVYNAAPCRAAANPPHAAPLQSFASEVAERVASLAVNLFGGNGFVKDYPVEKLYRDAKIGQIYEGTSNLQLQTIAKQLLG